MRVALIISLAVFLWYASPVLVAGLLSIVVVLGGLALLLALLSILL
ncbi:hypothetical protein [Salmonella phage vB_SenM-S16]|uniref:Uncharacterized protein n=4 Tax=Gelderlandvirus TaxID=1913653 RepID=M1H9A8_BPS16|nr:hypothetical protein I133_gp009 [Salmonella phage vB_SenM-S16]YP_009147984.1 hypothetical protein ACQ31_gp059 [Salmonella phage STML-198]YP_009286616.1 hypothetical protein BI049_gp129 [Salmonella phage vB_SnwM_CGG4-1]YP_009615740.1 hypothetical protein FDI73_gp136 [Salmonella phage Melville]AFU63942.1 hypothetical protein [Salmonella phage STML-198]AGE48219.1 hypothetical protein [Salmonella phage vB_SenM-S16]ANA49604.1 hypothetical protein CGG41_250 [Salmonella phage vB_SnwM_CGG4-1]ATN9